jgi:hypothetical protein
MPTEDSPSQPAGPLPTQRPDDGGPTPPEGAARPSSSGRIPAYQVGNVGSNPAGRMAYERWAV